MSIRFLPSVPPPPFNFERTKIHFPSPIPKPSSQLTPLLLTTATFISCISSAYFIYIKYLKFDAFSDLSVDYGFGYAPNTPLKPKTPTFTAETQTEAAATVVATGVGTVVDEVIPIATQTEAAAVGAGAAEAGAVATPTSSGAVARIETAAAAVLPTTKASQSSKTT